MIGSPSLRPGTYENLDTSREKVVQFKSLVHYIVTIAISLRQAARLAGSICLWYLLGP